MVVKCQDEELHCSSVISALPSFKLAELLLGHHPKLANLLKSIEFVTVGLANLEWTGQKLNHDAFGFLVPSTENPSLLGVVYDSCCFPQGDRTIMTAMMGGRWFESSFGSHVSEQTLLEFALKQVEKLLGIRDPVTRAQVHIHKQW